MLNKLVDVTVKGVPSTSGGFSLDLTDVLKVLRTALFVGGSAILTYVIEHATEMNLGAFQPYIILGLTTLAELVTRYIKSNK